ncbi:TPA: hypothetical protein ACP3ZG_000603 [Pseudomonas aeruginosa]|uniref:hypothetical protein n=1 Tax=Pseudomonas TaxID=286 RepID=UPI0007EE4B81|nr:MULTISPECIES: hypothetical protein [Pseudomonas]MBI6603642.1 hypothetical protein [Pseudomonas sp. S4_EA_1b]MBI8852234.1 hypothetical protein [Pseudomonas aeruginosa]OBY57028.1 hypothetical protein A9513_016065 [Pseudomonas sp. AU12215]HDU2625769.1 hypothetical protein [Pseudomonas aeruginosa]
MDQLSQTPPETLPLKVFIVADHEWYAAHSAAHALELHHALSGEIDESLTVEFDVSEASETQLDTPWANEEQPGIAIGTAREWLASKTEPGWLTGTE